MTFNFKALLVFVVFVAVFWLLLQSASTGDRLVNAVMWGLIVAMSVVAITLTISRGGVYGQDAVVPRWLRRWVLGESGKDDTGRKE